MRIWHLTHDPLPLSVLITQRDGNSTLGVYGQAHGGFSLLSSQLRPCHLPRRGRPPECLIARTPPTSCVLQSLNSRQVLLRGQGTCFPPSPCL